MSVLALYCTGVDCCRGQWRNLLPCNSCHAKCRKLLPNPQEL